ncbi:hypothetical protein I7I48_02684 [Histoplasma ohiense]|nr:hypothetical protein I7I48_02684 [Histoplasma ohiense (nom. inval.)]
MPSFENQMFLHVLTSSSFVRMLKTVFIMALTRVYLHLQGQYSMLVSVVSSHSKAAYNMPPPSLGSPIVLYIF